MTIRKNIRAPRARPRQGEPPTEILVDQGPETFRTRLTFFTATGSPLQTSVQHGALVTSLAATLALCLLAACTRDRGAPTLYEIGAHLLDEVPSRTSACAIGDQIRPALDCPAPLLSSPDPANAKGGAARRTDAPQQAPRMRTASMRIPVPSGAELSFGLGLAAPSRSPVDFTIVAQSESRTATLFKARLEPDGAGEHEWINRRISLAEFAGERVEIRYRAEVIDAENALAFPVWGDPQLLVPAHGEPANVIIISFDTLRADALGVYGSDVGASPALDRFADEGALITNAQAPFPATWASHLSLMTGVYPLVHGVILEHDGGRLPTELPTLAERLAKAHYQTAAVTENGYIIPEVGFSRGVSYYIEYSNHWNAGGVDVTFARAREWIEAHRDEVFFLFLHTYQVHFPYAPPAKHDVFKEPSERDRDLSPSLEILLDAKTRREFAAVAKKAYAGELRFADVEFGRLLAELNRLSLQDRTIIIVTADHGEAFDEHGNLFHNTLYDEVLRVPFVVRAPGLVPAGQRLDGPASLVDVVPTVLDLVGLSVPTDLQGENLAPALRRQAKLDPSRAIFAVGRTNKGEVAPLSVQANGIKWIEKRHAPMEVYDLAADPGEQKNQATAALVREGQTRFDAFRRDAEKRRFGFVSPEAAADSPTIDTARKQKLRALGYID